MKKLLIGIVALLLSGTVLFAQPVSDNAVIPVSITLNSILRLNIVSGGNIEFAVNTLEQYTDGVANSTRYDTRFTIASSVDFDVIMYSEDAALVGSDVAAGTNTLPLDNVGYTIESNGTAIVGTEVYLDGAGVNPSTPVTPLLSVSSTTIVEDVGVSAGDIEKNDYTIHWELATSALRGVTDQITLLAQSADADRYATNVFLVLDPK